MVLSKRHILYLFTCVSLGYGQFTERIASFFPAAVRFDQTMFYGLTVFVGSVEHSFFIEPSSHRCFTTRIALVLST